MTARMRRLLSDFEQVKKDFAGHKNIIVTPIGDEPPEKYHVTYFVNGIYLLPDGRIETLGRHEVEISLHAEYPRYKPLCKILTPIWHPNFRDGQICIGDIWGAGESLTDIIINIGDMIQYRSWNASSPLSADAAKWAIENKHLFPVGNIDLYIADYSAQKDMVEIDLFGDDTEEPTETVQPTEKIAETTETAETVQPTAAVEDTAAPEEPKEEENDFEITAEDLAGVEFVPTAQRMQSLANGRLVKGKKINIKTIFVKGLLWALIGAFVGFGISELFKNNILSDASAAEILGCDGLAEYYRYQQVADTAFEKLNAEFEDWCEENNVDSEEEDAIVKYLDSGDMSKQAEHNLEEFLEYGDEAEQALYNAFVDDYYEDEEAFEADIKNITRISTAMWTAVIALFIGLFLGLGEGVYYGSAGKAAKYALIGAAISLVIGFISGYFAQWMYSELLEDDPEGVVAALIRGIGWAIMGLGIGVSVGLIKPQGKRILFCTIGGCVGAFAGGFLFDYVCEIIPNDVVARGVAITIMGILIGIGVGLLEQFAKAAWLKVIRGEFEGKEYLVFAGTTSIGNNGKNTVVLFKDKLVGPHHCDIKLEGGSYVLIDCGTPMGTIVNGRRITRHVLRRGDAIAIGNSVLVFNTK